MNIKFFVDGRWYKTPCKTVLNAEHFTVKFFTDNHTILANVPKKNYFDARENKTLTKVTNKMYFYSIDCRSIFPLKRDFHFRRDYTNPQKFLSILYDTLDTFLNTSLSDDEKLLGEKRPVYKNYDELIERILEIVDVNDYAKLEKEHSEEKTELNTKYGVLADDQFHILTKTLIKSLFKAIGTNETRKIHFIISNNMVFFNYKGIQYKYYPAQCKVFKKCGRKYQRINWKDFTDDNSPNGQKQALGRSPPFTPDIRISTINDLNKE